MRDWPPLFTLCLPFVGCFGGLLVYLHTGCYSDREWLLKGLLLGLSAGLVVDMGIALWDWLRGSK